ncbi:TIGR02611 family protein [Mycolicibacterium sarraceniae]|uniref:TIGR02611 family protein n=1 Tax=Mycolicibacterium sarraceniae TaxID=1534348 RepID=A0A7I7SVH9_9MYCO|nr:TIGR02611 family protein [Mycolicibacterium sarraceniae]BBY60291.1 TIGR02611 family protein [Mycolicibacterium sarraceniae]
MRRWRHAWAHRRDRLRERPVADFAYRVVVGVVGLVVLLVGIIAIPYPGPGWAIVFVGLAILATEFYWAHRTLTFTRDRYDSAMAWFRGQGWFAQALGAVFTAAVVVATLWLVGAVGWSAGLLGFDHPALDSPIGLGA